MIPYIIVLIILIWGVIGYHNNIDSKRAKSWLFVEWLSLVLLAGLRYKVGGDTIGYFNEYETWPTLLDLINFDFSTTKYGILWIVFESTCRTISKDFAFLQIVHAIVFNGVLFHFLSKHTKHVFFAVLIYALVYFFKYNTGILRASMAVSVFLMSFDYYVEKKWSKYLLCCFIAIGFHTEAICLLFFPLVHYFLKEIKPNLISAALLMMISVGAMSINLLPFMQWLVPANGNSKELFELYGSISTLGEGISILGYLYTFVSSFLWIIVFLLLRDEKYVYIRPFICLFYFSIFQNLNYATFFNRFQDFLIQIMLVALVESMEKLKMKKNMLLSLSFYVLLSDIIISFIMVLLNGHWILYFPYTSIFSPEDNYLREEYFYSIFQQ